MDDSATAAHLYHGLLQTLARRVVHLQRFDAVLRNTFDSEGERPLVGTVFPDTDTLHAMLDRLSTIASTADVPEKWVLPGIELLRGEIAGETTQFKSSYEPAVPAGEDASTVEVEKVPGDEVQIAADPTSLPPPSPGAHGSPPPTHE